MAACASSCHGMFSRGFSGRACGFRVGCSTKGRAVRLNTADFTSPIGAFSAHTKPAHHGPPCHTGPCCKESIPGRCRGVSAVRRYVGRPPTATASCRCRPDRARLDPSLARELRLPTAARLSHLPQSFNSKTRAAGDQQQALQHLPRGFPDIKSIA